MENKQVHVIECDSIIDLEMEINDFLNENNNVIDVKVMSSHTYEYIALIIYKVV